MGTRNAEERRKAAGKHGKESFSGKLEVVARYEPQANKKFFGAAVFQKCCRGVGEQPTFAEQTRFFNLFSLLQLHVLKLSNSDKVVS